MLCTLTLNGLVSALKTLSFDAGREFEVVTVSFDPARRPELAAAKKAAYLERYERPRARGGLALPDRRRGADRSASPRRSASATPGTRRRGSSRTPRAWWCSPPEGRIARYLYGVEYAPQDLRFALVEASARPDRHRRRPGRCSTATSTTPRPAATRLPSCGSCALAASLTVLGLGAFVIVTCAAGARAGRGSREGPAEHVVRLPALPRAGLHHGGPRGRALLLPVRGHRVLLPRCIAALVVVFAVRYRRRSPDERPPAIHGSLALELTWTLIPLVHRDRHLLWSAELFFPRSARARPTRWRSTWSASAGCGRLQHMTGQREINELHVPVGVPVKLTLTSEDVIHSFFVPAFRVKKDAVPGPLHRPCGSRPPSRAGTTSSAPSTAAPKHSQMIGCGRGDGAGRLPGLAGRRGRPGLPGRGRGQKLFQRAGLRDLPPRGLGGARPARWTGLFGRTVRSPAAGTVHGRRRPTSASRS